MTAFRSFSNNTGKRVHTLCAWSPCV